MTIQTETNAQGNTIERSFIYSPNNIGSLFPGNWETLYSFADYDFGYVDHDTLRTLAYTEGDVTLVTCPTMDSFNAELEAVRKFNEDG